MAVVSIPVQHTEAAATQIASWKFDEGTGKTTKETVSALNDAIHYVHNNAVYKPSSDPIWRSDGISNSALLFDGYSNWVTHNPIQTPTNAMTIEAWVAPRAYEWGDNGILSAIVNQHDKPGKQGFLLGMFRHGAWSFQIGSKGQWYEVWSHEPLPKFEWSHIVATVDGTAGTMKLYLNGKEVASRTIPANSTITHSSNPLLIGKNNQSTQLAAFPLNMFNGLIDELKINSGAYSAAEAESAYQSYLTQLGGNVPTPNLSFDRSVYSGDKHRPTYHAIAPGHWMNEPHAPLYYNGQYHLFYQNNQHGPYWHNMHWGHWVSEDMVHWRDLPPALAPELFQADPDGDWTGTAVLDDSGNPTLFFTAGNDSKPYISSNQNVGVARSTVKTDGDNDLKSWVKERKLAVAQQPGQGKLGEFRDPYVFKDGSTWFMFVGTGIEGQGGTAAVYSTTDPNLMNWMYRGPLYQTNQAEYPYLGAVWELPVLLPLGKGKHVLAISPVGPGADVEVYYWIGSWNSSTAKFIPDHPEPQLMDFGDFKFTGPSGFTDPATGRNIMFTIAQGERPSQEESDAGWAHNAGLPVELSLRADGRLGIKPIDELQSLRGQQLLNMTTDTSFAAANQALSSITGDTLEIELELARGSADQVGIKVRKSPNSEEETLVYYKNSTDEYGVDRTKTVAGTSKGIQKGKVDIGSENVKLHLYLDKSMLESYLNGLKSITTRTYSTRDDAKGLQLWGDANTNSIVVKSLKVWRMNSAYETVPVSGVTLSPASLQVTVGGKKSVYATVAPANATNKNVTWTSSNPSVATVNNGVVTGKASGTATITAKTRDGSKMGSSTVTVATPPASVNLTNGGFETGDLSGWIVESGNAFTNAAVTNEAVFWDNQPFNHKGNYHLWGNLSGGDASTGVLKSQVFTLGGNGQVSFLVGGGSDIDKLYIAFVRASDGKELFRSTGPGTYWNWQSNKGETEAYTRRYWDATEHIGTSMYIKVVDERSDGWGHLNVDDFIVPVQNSGPSDTQAPSAPTNLASSSKTSTSVSLTWTASTDNVGVTGYNIYRGGTKIGTSAATSYTDSGLNASTAYTYTVKAVDAAGNESAASNSLSVTTNAGAADTQAPSAPTNLASSSKTSTSVSLTWTASTDNVGVTGYNIYRGGTKIGTSAATGYTDSGLNASTAYTYTVKAVDAAGNESAASNSLSVTTETVTPGEPQGIANHDFESGDLSGWTVVSGNAFSAGDVTADTDWGWGGPFKQNGTYHLWGFKDGGDDQVGILKSETFTLGGNGVIDFLIGGGKDLNNLYVAFVRASDGVELMKATGNNNEEYTRVEWNAASHIGTTGYIKVVDNATGDFGHINLDDVNVPTQQSSTDSTAPTAPSNVATTATSAQSISLTWSASTDNVGVVGYRVYRNDVEVGAVTATNFTDNGLAPSTSYTYTVKAYDAAGNLSASSASLAVTTTHVQLRELTNHDFESGDLSGWTVVSGNAFNAGDVTTDTDWGWGGPFNQNGTYHLWGFKDGGDDQVGVLKSETFTLGGNGAIDFLIGGGHDLNNLYVALVRASDGVELMKATGNNNEAYSRVHWNAEAFIGTACYIKIVDQATGGFGHLNVDDVNVPVVVSP
ncbi:GH32 C-terminal domain-containing protein [Paenibacillus puerhi]|uniref:GH32 C-terminal domain-containing protein n=1 Tax=Paenibacillus puerhi TaxID=2692622 RepID=UPI0038B38753